MALSDAFIWGKNGEKLTPEQVARERERIAAIQGRAGDTSPVGHWSQGMARVVDALTGVVRERRADKAEAAGMEQGRAAFDPVLQALLGGSGTMSSMGGNSYSPGGTWTPAPPPPSPMDTLGMTGGNRFGLEPAPVVGGGGLGFGDVGMTPQQMLIAGAEARGLNPIDVATAISYETGGKFDPLIAGPTTQWGQHRGLIQFGEPQAQQYGADFSSPEAAMRSQLDPETGAVWNYLDQTGVQPGMGLDNIYSAINAGAPGRFGASDANNGGAPGTVADKVAGMGAHREKAAQFLGGTWTPSENVTMSTMGGQAPAGGQGGILAALLQAQADPWAAKQYGGVMNALLGSELQSRQQAQDPMRQLEMQRAQLEIDALRNPAAPKPIEVGGVLLDPTTYQPIFDSRTPNAPEQFTLGEGQQRYDAQGNVIASGAQPVAPRPMTLEERAAWNIPATDVTPYYLDESGQPKAIGGGGINITLPGQPPADDALRKKLMESEGVAWGDYLKAGTTASATQQDMELLNEVIGMAPQGPVSGRLAEAFPGVSDAAGVFQSVVKRIAPSLRVEGSGSQSDIEYNGFLQSLPSLTNRPEANRAIASFLQAKAKVNMDRGAVIASYQNGEIDAATARGQITEIDKRSIMTPEMGGLLGAMDGGAAAAEVPPVPAGVSPDTWPDLWEAMTPEQRALFQ